MTLTVSSSSSTGVTVELCCSWKQLHPCCCVVRPHTHAGIFSGSSCRRRRSRRAAADTCSSAPGVADGLSLAAATQRLSPAPLPQRAHEGGRVVVVQLLEKHNADLQQASHEVLKMPTCRGGRQAGGRQAAGGGAHQEDHARGQTQRFGHLLLPLPAALLVDVQPEQARLQRVGLGQRYQAQRQQEAQGAHGR